MKKCIKNTEGKENVREIRLNNIEEVIRKIEKDIEALKQRHRFTEDNRLVSVSSIVECRGNRNRRSSFKNPGGLIISDDRLSSKAIERIRRMVIEKEKEERRNTIVIKKIDIKAIIIDRKK